MTGRSACALLFHPPDGAAHCGPARSQAAGPAAPHWKSGDDHAKDSGRLRCAGIALAAALLASCTEDGDEPPPDAKPPNVGAITKISYDGVSDDLLTAGLGRTGLGGTAPVPANPASPTAAELRRLAIFSNYTALVDVNPKGGYGTLFGPNIDATGADALAKAKSRETSTSPTSTTAPGAGT